MSKMFKNIIFVILLFVNVSCSHGMKQAFGLRNNAPDEFKIVSSAPLTLPPEFTIRPPVQGVKERKDMDLQQQAKDSLFENKRTHRITDKSKGEEFFLKKAAIDAADPEIKFALEQEEIKAKADAEAKKKQSIFKKISTFLGFTKDKSDNEPIVTTNKEKEIIKENKKDNKSKTDGAVPSAEKNKDGLLNNIFGF